MNATLTADPSLGTFESHLADADAAMNRGDRAAAISHLSAATELQPANAALQMALGNCLLDAGDFAEAVMRYDAATALQPDQDAPYACLALALQLQGRTPLAQRAAVKALKINQANDIALKVLARITLNGGDPALARNLCLAVLSRNPADADALALRDQADAALPSTPKVEGLGGDFATRTKTWQWLGPEHLLQQFVVGLEPKRVVIQPRPVAGALAADGLPIPPVDLRMGYAGNDTEMYFRIGARSYASLQQILTRQGLTLGAGNKMLDWGCASGRVLRSFLAEQKRGCEVWGGDVHVPSMNWAKANLPQFRFFTCSSLPHLPFPENNFKFIYALSVLTHIVGLRDLWLLEIARVLRPDGIAVLTVHDESTWACFRQHGAPGWMPPGLIDSIEMPGECIDIQGSSWEQTYTFFHSDYIRRTWGQYFDVLDIVPRAEAYQTAVVLRKRST